MLFATDITPEGWAVIIAAICGGAAAVIGAIVTGVLQIVTLWRQGTTQQKLQENTEITIQKGNEAKKEAVEAKQAALLLNDKIEALGQK